MNKGCKGCYNINNDGECIYSIYDNSLCPCSLCLVKTMCVKSCDLWDKFRHNDLTQEIKKVQLGLIPNNKRFIL